LVLNDVGAGCSMTSVCVPRIEQLLCARWDAGLPTIVTSNLDDESFWRSFGGEDGRLADRLRADPVGWIDCLEDSLRQYERIVAGVRSSGGANVRHLGSDRTAGDALKLGLLAKDGRGRIRVASGEALRELELALQKETVAAALS
jgi:hypothetical protein